MATFEERLDALISEDEKKRQLSDELYNKYVQFVGALDALPQDQLAIDWKTTDVHDQFGRVKPLSQWPTKTSRARSEKVWLNYNQKMQLQAAAKEAGLEGDPEPEPTEDPNFLSQMLDTCVRTSMSMGGLDRNTAFRHCSRQVKRFEQAIQGALADKGLPKKELEEFISDLLKGMANGKQIDLKDLSIEDRQFVQDLKDSLAYKKRDTGIKEDLDDKDVFRSECTYYDCDNRPDSEEFHVAHTTAFNQAKKIPNTTGPLSSPELKSLKGPKFSDVYGQEMAKFGYHLIDTGKPVVGGMPWDTRTWVKKSLKEDVETARPTPTIILPNMKSLAKGDWIELGPLAKPPGSGEGLDDQDEFGRDQDYPITPVQIVDVSEMPSRRVPIGTSAPLRVRVNNFNLLSLPDKSGVRWHGRPKHHEPSWYQPWHGAYSDWDLETMFSDGELRIVDNIEQWFQAQPEK